MRLSKRIAGAMLTLGLLVALPSLSNTNLAYGYDSIEAEFKEVIGQYNKEDLIIENGIALKLGESLDISQHPNWKLSNNDVVKIDSKGILTPINEGTVFLTQQINGKTHVTEIYVSKNQIVKYAKEDRSIRDKYKVFIDPGHGGSDSGATGYGKNEKDINLEVSNKVKSILESRGIEVVMSRTTDVYLSLSERAELANNYGTDIFVSIHQNSASSLTAAGIETYYHSNKAAHKPLSTEIQNDLIRQTGAKNRGVKSANFGVLRMSNMTSSLVECGFISNVDEYYNLANSLYQDKLALGIANGIEKYLKTYINLGTGEDEGKEEGTTEEDKEQDNVQEDIAPEVIATGVVYNTESLNVRAGYGTSYSVIGALSQGSVVEIYETKNGWHKIKFNGGYGYVSASYINVGFEDTKGHWAKDAIDKFVAKGFVGGYDDNTFRPNNDITRAEFVRIVNKVFGLTDLGSEDNINFSDVSSSAWYYTDLRIGVNAGYINGYNDNTFRPNGKITREEAAAIVANITKLKGDGVLNFADNDSIAPWAKISVDALSDNNIMGGYADNTFKPKNSITRAEAVATLSRVMK